MRRDFLIRRRLRVAILADWLGSLGGSPLDQQGLAQQVQLVLLDIGLGGAAQRVIDEYQKEQESQIRKRFHEEGTATEGGNTGSDSDETSFGACDGMNDPSRRTASGYQGSKDVSS